MARIRMASAATTLRTLKTLIEDIPNMVIRDEIASQARSTTHTQHPTHPETHYALENIDLIEDIPNMVIRDEIASQVQG